MRAQFSYLCRAAGVQLTGRGGVEVGRRGSTQGALGGAEVLQRQVGLADMERFLFRQSRGKSF